MLIYQQTHYDPVYDLMLGIKIWSDYEYPIVKNTIGVNDYQSTIVDEPIYEPFYKEGQHINVTTMGGSSQVECYLSKDRAIMSDIYCLKTVYMDSKLR